jgi:hypothetical protein
MNGFGTTLRNTQFGHPFTARRGIAKGVISLCVVKCRRARTGHAKSRAGAAFDFQMFAIASFSSTRRHAGAAQTFAHLRLASDFLTIPAP